MVDQWKMVSTCEKGTLYLDNALLLESHSLAHGKEVGMRCFLAVNASAELQVKARRKGSPVNQRTAWQRMLPWQDDGGLTSRSATIREEHNQFRALSSPTAPEIFGEGQEELR